MSVVSPSPNQRESQWVAEMCASLCEAGVLEGLLRVPDAVGPIHLMADLRSQMLAASVSVAAPQDKGARGRISWLLAQLARAPDAITVETWLRNGRSAAVTATLGAARAERTVLLDPDRRDPARFRLILRAPMGAGRKGPGRKQSFVDSVLHLLDSFYEDVVQDVAPWRPAAPRRRVLDEGTDAPTARAETEDVRDSNAVPAPVAPDERQETGSAEIVQGAGP